MKSTRFDCILVARLAVTTAEGGFLLPDRCSGRLQVEREPFALTTAASLSSSFRIPRLASVTLQNGDVVVFGPEYSGPNLAQNDTHDVEIYDPVTNTWSEAAPVPGTQDFGDESVEVLPNGTVLVSGGFTTTTCIYNPATNTWSDGPKWLNGDEGYEENWVKLADGSILAVPTEGTKLSSSRHERIGNAKC